MAKRTITINDGSKQREQVELNLNPVALTPTVRSGGQYNVVVQQTPKTNSALQLAQALRDGVGVYGQAVKVNQKRAEEAVASMTDEEYEAFLEEGLDPEAKSLFGYTKQYNRSLAQKYYAETMPSKLQDLSLEMHKSYYDYKTPDEFDAALDARVGGLFEEADELLGGNVFGNEANQVLKNATTADFVTKERAKFIETLPTRLREMAVDSITRTIDNLDVENIEKGQLFTALDTAFTNNQGDLGNKEANDAIFTALVNKIEPLILSNDTQDNELAQSLIDSIGDGKTYEGSASKKVGSQDMFATSERQLTLSKLEAALEEKRGKEFERAQNRVKGPLASIESEVIQILNQEGTEEEAEQVLRDRIASINDPKSEDYVPNQSERDLLTLGVQDVLNNTKLFKDSYPTNFIDNTSVLKREITANLFNNIPFQYTEAVNETAGASRVPKGLGVDYMEQAQFKLENLYLDIFKKISGLSTNEEKQTEFIRLEQEYVVPAIKEWTDNFWSNPSVSSEVDEAAQLQTTFDKAVRYSPEDADEFKNNRQALEAIIADGEDADRTSALTSSNNVRGLLAKTRLNNYIKAQRSSMLSGDDLNRNFNNIHDDFRDGIRLGNKITAGTFSHIGRTLAAQELASNYTATGISSKALLSGIIPNNYNPKDRAVTPTSHFSELTSFYKSNPMSFNELFDGTGLTFDKFPIVVDGDIQTTIKSVEGYFGAKDLNMLDSFYEGPFGNIADKYGISLDALMEQQRSYLQQNNFIKSE